MKIHLREAPYPNISPICGRRGWLFWRLTNIIRGVTCKNCLRRRSSKGRGKRG